MNVRVLSTIRNSKGRFFGLYTKQGEALNARFVSESPCYMTVFDRNDYGYRTLAKTSLAGIRIRGRSFGKTSV